MAFYDKQHRGLTILLLGAAAALAGATAVDYPLTKWLGENSWPAFGEFMSRSLFEGERPGGGDPVILFLIGVIFVYVLSLRPTASERIAAWRPALGFVLVGAVLNAVIYVHTLKWLVARARPYLVFGGQYPFSTWFEIGPHFITEGMYHGSFFSGHTAQAFVMMTLAYALAGSPPAGRGRKAAGWIVGVLAAGYTLAMGLARCMTAAHWVTDVVGAMAISWVMLHILYFYILKVPQQEASRRQMLYRSSLKTGWELFLGLYLAVAALGIVVAGIGLRAFWIDHARRLTILLFPGIPLAAWGVYSSVNCCRRLYRSLAAVKKEPFTG